MILLDSHVLIWAVSDSKHLSIPAASAIRRARRSGGVAVSAISAYEVAWQIASGRVQGYGTVEAALLRFLVGVTVRPITPEIAALATQFPEDFPRDPADRIIGATARAEGMTLVTRDERIRRSPLVRTVW
ncbi:MAG: type II toxin-antitoxin system VapC family toxin [Terriglobales bacterium]